MRLRIFHELRCLGNIAGKLIGVCFCTASCGILTWVTCNNIAVVWRVSIKPPFTLPISLMFFIWLAVYAMYGAVICINAVYRTKVCVRNCFNAVAAYFLSLFWCPLIFFSGTGFIALAAIIISVTYNFIIMIKCRRFSGLIFFLCAAIIIVEIYCLYFTIGFIILN